MLAVTDSILVSRVGADLGEDATRGSNMVLCMMFGITASVCSLFLRFGRRLMLRALQHDAKAAVRIPTGKEVHTLQEAFAAKYSFLGDVYAVTDGLKIYLEKSGHCVIQNMF